MKSRGWYPFHFEDAEIIPSICSATGLERNCVVAGLLDMRMHCFTLKTSSLAEKQIKNMFGGCDEIIPTLVEYGVLKRSTVGLELRFADAMIAARESKRERGIANRQNLKQFKTKTATLSSVSPDNRTGLPDGQPIGNDPAQLLTENCKLLKSIDADASVETAAQKEKPKEPQSVPTPPSIVSTLPASFDLIPTAPPPPKKVKAPPDPRKSALKEKLKEAYEARIGHAYLWQNVKDNVALDALCKTGDDDEIIQRFLTGLNATGWKQIRGVAQLASKWNDLASEQRSHLAVGGLTHKEIHSCQACGAGASAGGWNIDRLCYSCIGEAQEFIAQTSSTDSFQENCRAADEWLAAKKNSNVAASS